MRGREGAGGDLARTLLLDHLDGCPVGAPDEGGIAMIQVSDSAMDVIREIFSDPEAEGKGVRLVYMGFG